MCCWFAGRTAIPKKLCRYFSSGKLKFVTVVLFWMDVVLNGCCLAYMCSSFWSITMYNCLATLGLQEPILLSLLQAQMATLSIPCMYNQVTQLLFFWTNRCLCLSCTSNPSQLFNEQKTNHFYQEKENQLKPVTPFVATVPPCVVDSFVCLYYCRKLHLGSSLQVPSPWCQW